MLNPHLDGIIKTLVENQARLTEDMLCKIDSAIAIANEMGFDITLDDGITKVVKSEWLRDAIKRKEDYRNDLDKLKELRRLLGR